MLHSFTGGPPDGEAPIVGLIQGSDGNFYGTAGGGKFMSGTIFMITSAGVETVLELPSAATSTMALDGPPT